MILKSKKEVTWVPCICLLSYMKKDELASQQVLLPCLAILEPPYGGHNVCTKGQIKPKSRLGHRRFSQKTNGQI